MIYIMAKTKATGIVEPMAMFGDDEMKQAVVQLLRDRKKYTRRFLYIEKGKSGRGKRT
jgi:hypothetical protein